jgi:hypothetical protein
LRVLWVLWVLWMLGVFRMFENVSIFVTRMGVVDRVTRWRGRGPFSWSLSFPCLSSG